MVEQILLPSYMSFSDLIYSKHIWIVWNNTYFLFICFKKCKCKCNMIEWIIIANFSFLSYHRSRYPFSWPCNFSIPLNIMYGVILRVLPLWYLFLIKMSYFFHEFDENRNFKCACQLWFVLLHFSNPPKDENSH